jgi:hypothetical protein
LGALVQERVVLGVQVGVWLVKLTVEQVASHFKLAGEPVVLVQVIRVKGVSQDNPQIQPVLQVTPVHPQLV